MENKETTGMAKWEKIVGMASVVVVSGIVGGVVGWYAAVIQLHSAISGIGERVAKVEGEAAGQKGMLSATAEDLRKDLESSRREIAALQADVTTAKNAYKGLNSELADAQRNATEAVSGAKAVADTAKHFANLTPQRWRQIKEVIETVERNPKAERILAYFANPRIATQKQLDRETTLPSDKFVDLVTLPVHVNERSRTALVIFKAGGVTTKGLASWDANCELRLHIDGGETAVATTIIAFNRANQKDPVEEKDACLVWLWQDVSPGSHTVTVKGRSSKGPTVVSAMNCTSSLLVAEVVP